MMATCLNEDILRLIFAQIVQGGRNVATLSSLALVSRQFYILTLPLLYHPLRIHIEYESQKCSAEVLAIRLTTKSKVVEFIRDIHIGRIYSHEEFVVEWLADMIPRLARLDAFHWSPADKSLRPIIELVRQHWPHCRLHPLGLDIGSSEGREMVDMIPQMLQDLQLYIPPKPDSGQAARINFIHATKNCPNVQTVDVWEQSGECVLYEPWRGPQARLDLSPGDAIPCPTQVKIMDAPFPWEDFGSWGNLGGWRKLTELTLRNSKQLQFFHGCEGTLRSLSLVNDWEAIDESAFEAFCGGLECLEEVQVVGTSATLPFNTLRQYGGALKQLDVHGYNSFKRRIAKFETVGLTQSCPDIQGMEEWCPKLSNVALDMFRNGDKWVRLYFTLDIRTQY